MIIRNQADEKIEWVFLWETTLNDHQPLTGSNSANTDLIR